MGQSALGHILQILLIGRCVNHKLSHVRTDDISGTNIRPDQTNIKGSDGLPLRLAVLEQRANPL